ncbi:MAG: DUF5011 domain-containing protein [Candidatus Vogelbacteria bacterium]|nr:DUF5011 domain-containing protein [Candidatus Vogelbacteria bacterium]
MTPYYLNRKEGGRIVTLFSRLLILVGIFLLPIDIIFASSGVPKILSHQGRLLDSSANLLGGSGTNYCFRFSIYDAVSNGNKLWPGGTPSNMTVLVKNGIYNVDIGDTNVGGDSLSLDFNDDSYYLNIAIANSSNGSCAGVTSFETLSPRKHITSSGYAINSGLLNGQAASYYLDANNLNNFGQLFNSLLSGTTTLPNLVSLPNLTSIGTLSSLAVSGTITLGGHPLTFPSGSGSNGDMLTTNGNGSLSWTSLLNVSHGGTGLASYSTGDILYASDDSTLAALHKGGEGSVLKILGGVPVWGVDLTSGEGGGSSSWATTTDNLSIIENDPTQVVVVGSTATSSTGYIFEVSGAGINGKRALIPYASTTMVTATTASTTELIVSKILTLPNNSISDSALSSNVALLNGGQTFTTLTGSGALTITGLSSLNGGASTTNISASGTMWTGGLSTTTGGVINTQTKYQIAGVDILTSNTLGSGIVTSSLTTVGALTSGSIASSFGSINIGSNAITAGAGTFTSVTDSGLTSGRIPFATAGGQLTDNSRLAWNNSTNVLTVNGVLAISGMTTGSIPFATAGGAIGQNNSNFFWDNTNSRLGLGTTSPSQRLSVAGNALLSGDLTLANLTATGTITAPNFSGALTGNVSGSAATVTGASQFAITTLANLSTVGTLTSGSIGSGFGPINIGSSSPLTAGIGTFSSVTVNGTLAGNSLSMPTTENIAGVISTGSNQSLSSLNGAIYWGKNKLSSDIFDETNYNFGEIWQSSNSNRDWQAMALSSNGQYQTAVVNGGQIYTSSNSGSTWTARDSNRIWTSVTVSASGQYQTAVAITDQIYTSSDYGVTWTARDSDRNWQAVAMSSDGSRQTAVESGGQIYVSTNYGATWTANFSAPTVANWQAVAMSANGFYQTALVSNGQIYTSFNYGVTWTARDSGRNWSSVAMSSTGQYQTAAVFGGSIYMSTNYGINWYANTTAPSSGNWVSVAVSGNGSNQWALQSGGVPYVTIDRSHWTKPFLSEPNRNWIAVAISPDITGSKVSAAVNGGQVFLSSWVGTMYSPPTSNDPGRYWTSVAMSADGSRQIAVEFGGNVYTSSDFANSWISRGNYNAWKAVAMSADGSRQMAVTNNGGGTGYIYTSLDYGVNWTQRNSNRNWASSVAISADGSRQTAAVFGGQIYTSSDYGVTWTARDSDRNWQAVAMSSDGSRQTAVESGGQIYTSSDYGVTWTARDSSRSWNTVAMSSDGSRQTALANSGQIYTSSDYGVTWTARGLSGPWQFVAMSADGLRQAAIQNNGNTSIGALYISKDYGTTWSLSDSTHKWSFVAISADGSRMTAGEFNNGRLYTSLAEKKVFTGSIIRTSTMTSASSVQIQDSGGHTLLQATGDGRTQFVVKPGVPDAFQLLTNFQNKVIPVFTIGTTVSGSTIKGRAVSNLSGMSFGNDAIGYDDYLDGVHASTTVGGINYTASSGGIAGNNIHVAIVEPGSDGQLSVGRDGLNVTVILAKDSGAVSSTIADVVSAVNGDDSASAVMSAIATGDDSVIASAIATSTLSGGETDATFSGFLTVAKTSTFTGLASFVGGASTTNLTVASNSTLTGNVGVGGDLHVGSVRNNSFETGTFSGWSVLSGNAFSHPVAGTCANQNAVSGYDGKYLINSYCDVDGNGNDTLTGVIRSDTFVLTGPKVKYLIGGGNDITNLKVEIVRASDDEVINADTHTEGGSEHLDSHTIDLSPYVNNRVYIKITDNDQGGWGHILFDDFRQLDSNNNVIDNVGPVFSVGNLGLYLDSSNNFSIGTSTLFASSNGNLGIGTTTPSNKLVMSGGNFLQVASGNLTRKGFISYGAGNSVYVSGKYAYIANGGDDRVVDISDPTNPVEVTSVGAGGNAAGVFVAGKYMYVANGGGGNGGLVVYDVSDLSVAPIPKISNLLDFAQNAENVFVAGKYAYVASGPGLSIMDVSDPYNLKEVSGTGFDCGAASRKGVYVDGKFAYLTSDGNNDSCPGGNNNAGPKYLKFNVSDPLHPQQVGNANLPAAAFGLYASGKYVYVADGTAGLQIVNALDDSIVGSYDTNGTSYNVKVAGNYAYVADGSNGLVVLDVSNPVSPVLVGTYTSSGTVYDVSISGKYAYITGTAGLETIDINGIDVPAINTGSLFANNLGIANDLDVANNLNIHNSLNIGIGGLYSTGPFAISGNATSTLIGALAGASGDLTIARGGVGNLILNPYGGNVGIGTNSPTQPLAMASGAYVTAGGTWTNASSRDLKENFTTLDPEAVLEQINQLAIPRWNYKNEATTTTHIGPIAQDFYSIFGLGGTTTGSISISTIDPAGVALLGIQGLSKRLNELAVSIGSTTATLSSEKLVYSKLEVDSASIKSAEISNLKILNSLIMEDRVTGDRYCVYIENGEWAKSRGDCDINDNKNSNNISSIISTSVETAPSFVSASTAFSTSTDREAPVLTLLGDATSTLKVGDNFVDPGSVVTDNVDQNLGVKVTGLVDTSKAGIYTLYYDAIDNAGNNATQLSRVVTIVDSTHSDLSGILLPNPNATSSVGSVLAW